MMKTSMATTPETVRVREGGPATGGIWILFGDRAFPVSGWDDFVVVILAAWVTSLLKLLRGEERKVMVHFMDGPYAVEVERTASSTLRVRALQGSGRSTEAVAGDAELLPFVSDLVAQARAVLAECRRRQWWSTDAETLEVELSALERACAPLYGPS